MVHVFSAQFFDKRYSESLWLIALGFDYSTC